MYMYIHACFGPLMHMCTCKHDWVSMYACCTCVCWTCNIIMFTYMDIEYHDMNTQLHVDALSSLPGLLECLEKVLIRWLCTCLLHCTIYMYPVCELGNKLYVEVHIHVHARARANLIYGSTTCTICVNTPYTCMYYSHLSMPLWMVCFRHSQLMVLHLDQICYKMSSWTVSCYMLLDCTYICRFVSQGSTYTCTMCMHVVFVLL